MDNRELDRLVAERVMGWYSMPHHNYWMTPPRDGKSFQIHELVAQWSPSSKIADAWQVVEKLRADGWSFHLLHHSSEFGHKEQALVELHWSDFTVGDRIPAYFGETLDKRMSNFGMNQPWAKEDTAPRAICLAALAAVGVKVD